MAHPPKLNLLLIPMLVLVLSAPAGAAHLQDIYDQAGPGEGYDKLLVLDPGEIYTGYLLTTPGNSCVIHGNGALISLDPGGYIWAYTDATLDIDGCVIKGGSNALTYEYCAASTVQNCTIVGNSIGIRVWYPRGEITIKNCIIVNNSQYGIACVEYYEPTILYNDVWGNSVFNYAAYCPG